MTLSPSQSSCIVNGFLVTTWKKKIEQKKWNIWQSQTKYESCIISCETLQTPKHSSVVEQDQSRHTPHSAQIHNTVGPFSTTDINLAGYGSENILVPISHREEIHLRVLSVNDHQLLTVEHTEKLRRENSERKPLEGKKQDSILAL